MMEPSRKIVFALCLVAVAAVPRRSARSSDDSVDKSFIGQGTEDLAKALLLGFVDEDENVVFSPFGYSSVLAIFAEGAKGESREEIATALHFPTDVERVRLAYRSVLEKLHVKTESNTPEFKNWFYVYKNYTVEEELKEVLRKYYLTEVKSVERPDDYVGNKKEKESEGSGTGSREEDERIATEEAPVTESATEKAEVAEAMQRSVAEGPIGAKDHFSGMTDSSLKIKGKGPQSQMIIFNGLYFKGDWKEPFVKKPADESRVFYKSEKEKISVSTISSSGEFLVGDVPNLDCRAIELPYEGERYALLILVPKSRDGLTKLVSDLSVHPIGEIYQQMTRKLVDVCLPSFEVDYISKPISSFTKLGLSKVTSIFDSEKADLSGVSKDPGLYVEELVQMVSLKVDADYSTANFLTSSLASVRSEYEAFPINQPFLFFLRDKVDDLIIVNGKLVDPTPKPDFFSP